VIAHDAHHLFDKDAVRDIAGDGKHARTAHFKLVARSLKLLGVARADGYVRAFSRKLARKHEAQAARASCNEYHATAKVVFARSAPQRSRRQQSSSACRRKQQRVIISYAHLFPLVVDEELIA
jgi:hypothetical protein